MNGLGVNNTMSMGIYGWDEPQINIYLTFEHLIFELKQYNIIKMELVQVANTLRHHLIALDNSEHNKAEIGMYIYIRSFVPEYTCSIEIQIIMSSKW